MNIKELREKLNMSQTEFSDYFGIPVKTLRGWEQGLRTPPPYVVSLIERIINLETLIKHP